MPTNTNLPFMDMITSTESCVLNVKHNAKENEAETLRQCVCNILQKNLNVKIRSNLKKDERIASKELQKNDKIRALEFDKGCGFEIVTNDTTKEKIEEQLDKATKPAIDPTSRLSRFRKNFASLAKKTNLQTRLILNYSHPTPFYQVLMGQSKRKNRKKIFSSESLYPQ